MASSKTVTRERRRATDRCKNLYEFIRLRLGDSVSDREIARRWGMEWKSFVTLKQGKRQMPRLHELEALAAILDVDRSLVFEVARGVPATEMSALLAREHRWRALLERVSDAVFTVDAHGRLQDVNHRFCAIVGRSAHDLAQSPLLDLVTPESAPRLVAAMATVERVGEASGVEVGLRDPQGRSRVVELAVARIADSVGAPIGAQFSGRDVTEERRMVREIDAQRRLLKTIYEHVPAACILFDGDGTILAANPLVEGVCSLASTELVGRNAFDVFGNPGPDGCPVTRAFLTGQTEQQLSWVENRAGQRVYVHRTAGPIVNQGRVDQVIEMMVDVTGQIRSGDVRLLALVRGQPEDDRGARANQPERRANPRAITAFVARYRRKDRQDVGTVVSLGAGGAFLQTQGKGIGIGDELELDWALPGDRVPVRAQGVVVWTRPTSAQSPGGLGIRFTSVMPEFARVTKRLHASS